MRVVAVDWSEAQVGTRKKIVTAEVIRRRRTRTTPCTPQSPRWRWPTTSRVAHAARGPGFERDAPMWRPGFALTS